MVLLLMMMMMMVMMIKEENEIMQVDVWGKSTKKIANEKKNEFSGEYMKFVRCFYFTIID